MIVLADDVEPDAEAHRTSRLVVRIAGKHGVALSPSLERGPLPKRPAASPDGPAGGHRAVTNDAEDVERYVSAIRYWTGSGWPTQSSTMPQEKESEGPSYDACSFGFSTVNPSWAAASLSVVSAETNVGPSRPTTLRMRRIWVAAAS